MIVSATDGQTSNSSHCINNDHQPTEPTSDNMQKENSEDPEPTSEELINTEMSNKLEASSGCEAPPKEHPRIEMKSPVLPECFTSPRSITSGYVEAKEDCDSPRQLQHAGLTLCYFEDSIEITTRSGEKITVKNHVTTIKSGSCQIDIKNGVLRLQTVEMDSLFNFQAPSV